MKYCTRVRIDSMLPNGMVTGVKFLDISQVPDDHDFGLHQEYGGVEIPEATERGIKILSPVLHVEGKPG